jgi:hypothetical protein
MHELEACAVDDIEFVKLEYRKEKKMLLSLVYDPHPPTQVDLCQNAALKNYKKIC